MSGKGGGDSFEIEIAQVKCGVALTAGVARGAGTCLRLKCHYALQLHFFGRRGKEAKDRRSCRRASSDALEERQPPARGEQRSDLQFGLRDGCKTDCG